MMNIKLSDKRPANLWLDRDIRFDVNSKELQIKDSEKKIRTFFSIEDTKGKKIFDQSSQIENKILISLKFSHKKATLVIMED